MKTPALLILLLFSTMANAADVHQKERERLVEYFKSSEEPKVHDAMWTADYMFKVGVIDDGTHRMGYAHYVCAVVKEGVFKTSDITVQVIDIAKLAKQGKWVKLGEAHCP